ncbi:MAG: hypothetical protein ABUK13_08115, partial [Gammaproteobacteria bacterium]
MDKKHINLVTLYLLPFCYVLFSSDAFGIELQPRGISQSNAPLLHKLEYSPEQFSRLANIKTKAPKLTPKETRLLRKISYDISANRHDQGKQRWEELLVSMGSKKNLEQEDVMTTLFYVFKETISDLNDDAEYFNRKLKMYQELGDAMREYVKELNEKMDIYEKEQAAAESKGDKKKDIVIKVIDCIPTRYSKNLKLKTSYQKFNQQQLEEYGKHIEK